MPCAGVWGKSAQGFTLCHPTHPSSWIAIAVCSALKWNGNSLPLLLVLFLEHISSIQGDFQWCKGRYKVGGWRLVCKASTPVLWSTIPVPGIPFLLTFKWYTKCYGVACSFHLYSLIPPLSSSYRSYVTISRSLHQFYLIKSISTSAHLANYILPPKSICLANSSHFPILAPSSHRSP